MDAPNTRYTPKRNPIKNAYNGYWMPMRECPTFPGGRTAFPLPMYFGIPSEQYLNFSAGIITHSRTTRSRFGGK
jgi:hypothetical protein